MSLRSLLFASALIVPGAAYAAPNMVVNGDFESTTTNSTNGNFQVTGANTYGTLSNWALTNSTTSTSPYVLLFTTGLGANATETTTTAGSPSNPNYAVPSANNQYGSGEYLAAGYNLTSPTGGNFIAMDGDPNVNGYLSQSISGLSIGRIYQLTFYWAAAQIATRTGATTDKLQVTFGSGSNVTSTQSIASGGFSGWLKETMFFTATSLTQTLSFLSIGTPAGYPPAALLDGISLVAAPEPSTFAILVVGLGGLGLMARRRRRG